MCWSWSYLLENTLISAECIPNITTLYCSITQKKYLHLNWTCCWTKRTSLHVSKWTRCKMGLKVSPNKFSKETVKWQPLSNKDNNNKEYEAVLQGKLSVLDWNQMFKNSLHRERAKYSSCWCVFLLFIFLSAWDLLESATWPKNNVKIKRYP